MERYAREIVTFCNVDPEREEPIQVLKKHLGKAALGIGEQKFELDADSPQMRWVYDVARDCGVLVLPHFESKHNLGFDRFYKILEAYPQSRRRMASTVMHRPGGCRAGASPAYGTGRGAGLSVAGSPSPDPPRTFPVAGTRGHGHG